MVLVVLGVPKITKIIESTDSSPGRREFRSEKEVRLKEIAGLAVSMTGVALFFLL